MKTCPQARGEVERLPRSTLAIRRLFRLYALSSGLMFLVAPAPASGAPAIPDASASAGLTLSVQQRESLRPSAWAQPIELPGVPNLYMMSDRLYRSGQPTAEGMARLEDLGIKTVLNISFHSDIPEMAATRMAYEQIYMKTWHPEEEDVVRFLRIVSDPGRGPVLVHCHRGADRTGTLCAIYRVVVQGWSKDDALREMTQGGFGFHPIWTNLKTFIKDLDIEAIRKEAGLVPSGPNPGP